MKFNPSRIKTSVGYSFAIAALCGMVIAPQAAIADEGADKDDSAESKASASTGKRVYSAPVASEKSETVYLFAKPDGTIKNTEVSTTLKNPLGEKELADSSVLTNIENAEDDATYSGSGDSMVWETAGKDVYYTGVTTKAAPVSVKVSYFLDGKKVSYDKLAGATGKLKIRYDYDNTATTKATINGKEETLYVPFTFITAMLVDNENFKNAEVVNGKIIDDGDRTIVAGYALPGLQKSLGNLVEDFDIPDYFEVTADVKDFEMQSSLTIATAGLLEDFDADDFDTSELQDASSELTDAMDQILSGTGDLKEGLDKLAAGAKSAKVASGQLASGASALADGADQLSEGVDTMKESTSELPDGVQALADGSNSLATALPDAVSGSSQLQSGATTLTKGLESLKSGLEGAVQGIGDAETEETLIYGVSSVKNDLIVLKSGDGTTENPGLEGAAAAAGQIGDDLTSAQKKMGTLADGLDDASTNLSSIQSGLEAYQEIIEASDQLSDEQKEAYKTALRGIGTVSNGLADSALSVRGVDFDTAINAATSIQNGLSRAVAALGDEETANTLIYGASAVEAGLEQLKYGDGTAENPGLEGAIAALGDKTTKDTLIFGANAIENGLSSLNSGLSAASDGANQLASGLGELNENVPALVEGVDSIADGATQLANGSQTLADGLGQYDDGMSALKTGTAAAASGAGTLRDGLQTFNDEGISEISDLIDDDILPFKDRLNAISDAAKGYNNFAGITEGTSGEVKFVIETDAITLDE